MNIFTLLFIQPLANGLILFYNLLGNNLGLAIIFFTLFLRFILNPLSKPYMESMKRMKDLAPQLEKLKEKHKDDKIKLAQAQADFYKENKVNPGAGCLPYLLQVVILIAFFNVFSKTLVGGADITGKFNELMYPALKFESGETVSTNFLYFDLAKPDKVSIPGIGFEIPGVLLILSALLQFVSAKVSLPYVEMEGKLAKKTAEKTDDAAVSMQKSMIYMFPIMTLFIGLNFASGLALYWLVFSLTQTHQQVKSQGWGSLSPFMKRLNLIKS